MFLNTGCFIFFVFLCVCVSSLRAYRLSVSSAWYFIGAFTLYFICCRYMKHISRVTKQFAALRFIFIFSCVQVDPLLHGMFPAKVVWMCVKKEEEATADRVPIPHRNVVVAHHRPGICAAVVIHVGRGLLSGGDVCRG